MSEQRGVFKKVFTKFKVKFQKENSTAKWPNLQTSSMYTKGLLLSLKFLWASLPRPKWPYNNRVEIEWNQNVCFDSLRCVMLPSGFIIGLLDAWRSSDNEWSRLTLKPRPRIPWKRETFDPKKTESCSWRLHDCWVRDEGLRIIITRDLWFCSCRTMLFITIVYDVLLSLKDGKDNFRILYWQHNKKTFWGFLCLHPFSSGRWFCRVFVLVLLKWFQKCFPTTVLIDSHFGICFISWQ